MIAANFELDANTLIGKSWREITQGVKPTGTTIRPLSNPLYPSGAFAMVKGNLAKDGAIIKVSAATPELMKHTGPAVVFHGYADMRSRIDDPSLGITKDSVLVLRDCGPVGVPGMPEWGMIPVPKKLLEQGVTDMVRISDARMSGTSFGTCILHVAPEAAIGGTLALVQDGDQIELDVAGGKLELLISETELADRKSNWARPVSEHQRGWPALSMEHGGPARAESIQWLCWDKTRGSNSRRCSGRHRLERAGPIRAGWREVRPGSPWSRCGIGCRARQ